MILTIKELEEEIRKTRGIRPLEVLEAKLEQTKEIINLIENIDIEKYQGEFCFKANTLKKELISKIGGGK